MRQIKRGHREEDEFLTTMQKIIKLIVRHRDTSIFIGIAIIAVAVLLVLFTSGREEQNPDAEILHTQAISLINMGRIQEAESTFLDLTKRYGKTEAGKIGLYYLGVIEYHSARFSEALDYFDRFIKTQNPKSLLVPSAIFGAGCAAEGLKDFARAQTYYEKLTKDKESVFYFIGTLAYGRVIGLSGDTEKAREILTNLLAQNPPADVTNDAKFYIGYFTK